jgi:hypothetical protein
MPKYTFYLEDGPATTPELVVEELADRDAALAYARRLLSERPRYHWIEIAEEGETGLGRVGR